MLGVSSSATVHLPRRLLIAVQNFSRDLEGVANW